MQYTMTIGSPRRIILYYQHFYNDLKHAKHHCIFSFLRKNENISVLRAYLLTLNSFFRTNILCQDILLDETNILFIPDFWAVRSTSPNT